jgi:DNA-formamidopyrimidine glycosylase
MPELPEVEVLVRHLAALLKGKTIREVKVRRAKILRPTHERDFKQTLTGATFLEIRRRGKYLLFTLQSSREREPILLVGHLGMSGRMYLQPSAKPVAKHAAVIFALGKFSFIYEDTRYFGRLTLDPGALARLGPEPFAAEFNHEYFSRALRQSVQPIKVKLLDQSLVVGLGNIYASEALFLAGILQFQFHRALAKTAGCTLPLNRCSIFESKEAGKRLNAMLTMGLSKPWPDALEAMTGSRQMDATAILDYFAPFSTASASAPTRPTGVSVLKGSRRTTPKPSCPGC